MNRPVNDSFYHELDSFIAGEHGQRLADVAADVDGIRNPADVLRDIDPDYHRSLYEGIDAAGFYELLRKVPIKPKQKLGRAVKAPLRTWSMTSATSMLRQLRRAKAYDMRFGLDLVSFSLHEASPVTSPCWPDAINAEAVRRAAERGVPVTTVSEAIGLYGVGAVRIGLIMAQVGSMEEALNVARVIVEDDLCPPAWRGNHELDASARAYIELAAAFDAHRYEHRDAHADTADDIDIQVDDEFDSTDITNVGDSDDAAADEPTEANDDAESATPASAPLSAAPDDKTGPELPPRTAHSASGAPARTRIVEALIEMRNLDAQIRALASTLDANSESSVLAANLEALRTPGPEGDAVDALAAALRDGTATEEQQGFVSAVVALATAAAAGADRAELRELDAAARRYPIAADLNDVLFDARARTEPLPQASEPDPLAAMVAAVGPGPLPYNDLLIDTLDQHDQDTTAPVVIEAIEATSFVDDASAGNALATDGQAAPEAVAEQEASPPALGTSMETADTTDTEPPAATSEPEVTPELQAQPFVQPSGDSPDNAGSTEPAAAVVPPDSDQEPTADVTLGGDSFADQIAGQAPHRHLSLIHI